MYTKYFIAMLVMLLLHACASSAPSNGADRFAGTWSGSMSFTDRENTEDVFVTIPAGCATGEACGEIFNPAVNCTWEVQLETVNRDVFAYTFSKTLRGECPAMGSGTFTVQQDGTLVREHVTPDFTTTGTLGRQAEGYKPMYGFAGTWSGSMIFAEDPDRQDAIGISIPTGCKIGNTCGDIVNFTRQCSVYMSLKSAIGDRIEYELSPSTIECPYKGAGRLTLQSDGTMLFEHTSPSLNTNTVLSRQ